MLFLAVF